MYMTQGPSGRSYHHNGDFSGDILCTDVSVDTGGIGGWMKTGDVKIPFEDMMHLVLAHFRSKAIGFLEQADDATLEKFFTNWSDT